MSYIWKNGAQVTEMENIVRLHDAMDYEGTESKRPRGKGNSKRLKESRKAISKLSKQLFLQNSQKLQESRKVISPLSKKVLRINCYSCGNEINVNDIPVICISCGNKVHKKYQKHPTCLGCYFQYKCVTKELV